MKTTTNQPTIVEHISAPTADLDQLMIPVTRESTQHALTTIQSSDRITQTLCTIDWSLRDQITDQQAIAISHGMIEPKPITNTLPAVISKQLMTNGVVIPQWHSVRNLPGYLRSAIRSLGRKVFSVYTSTDIEDIQVIACINNTGPNQHRELNAVAGFLQQHGEQITIGHIDFGKTINQYVSDITLYNSHGFQFLVVKDFAGQYIYAWTDETKLLK